MRSTDPQGAARRKRFKTTTIAHEGAERPPDLVARGFAAGRPNQLWVQTLLSTWNIDHWLSMTTWPGVAHEGDRVRTQRDSIRDMLADLRLPGALEAADSILAETDSGEITDGEAIEKLLSSQFTRRNNRLLQIAMRSARLPVMKTFEEFDSSFQPSVKREQIMSLAEPGFL